MILRVLYNFIFGARTRYAGAPQASSPLAGPSVLQRQAREESRHWMLEGVQLLARGELQEAARAFREALNADANNPAALNNLATLCMQSDPEEALRYLRRAEKLAPHDAAIHINLGSVLFDRCCHEEARAAYLRALQLKPADVDALRNLAMLDLALGRFSAETWRNFQARWLHPTFSRHHLLPGLRYLQAESLPRERLLVHLEQGLGDEIFYASCVRDAQAQAQAVALTCEPRLRQLMADAFPEVTVISREAGWEAHAQAFAPDAQCYAGDLPYWLRRGSASFPAPGAYLRADPDRAAHWANRLRALGPGLKIGISWRGGLPTTGRNERSVPLWEWASLFVLPGVHWVDLQYGDHGAELHAAQAAGVPITRFADALDDTPGDYSETAALVSQLDLVISVTTAVVDLAGALDVPCWVLVPRKPLWKFGVAGERTPWYPGLRLFRQGQDEKWGGVLGRTADALRAMPMVRAAR